LSWAVLFICFLPCSSESQLSRQQQMKSDGEKAAEYLKENRPDLAADEFRAILILDPNKIETVDKITVSPDGKKMTTVVDSKLTGRVSTFIDEKQ